MKNHAEMFTALLAGEILVSPSREYRLIDGKVHSLDLAEYSDGRWIELCKPPKYEAVIVKPKTIDINGYEVPEPIKQLGVRGTGYWVPNLNTDNDFATHYYWDGTTRAKTHLSMGFAHSAKEAAELHARALLSFTEQD